MTDRRKTGEGGVKGWATRRRNGTDSPQKLRAEIERLRRERNLLREMFNSAERELAAERERCAQLRDAAQGLLSAVGYDRKDMIDEAADKLAAELAAEREGEP